MPTDSTKTKKELVAELKAARQRITELEAREGELKRTKVVLKTSEERLRNLTEYIPGVSVQGYDTEGTVFYWNKASQDVYGYTTEEALGKNLADLIIPPDIRHLFIRALELGKTVRKSGEFLPPGELKLLHKDGHLVPVYSIHTCVCAKGQSPVLFCFDVDLSERKLIEEGLRASEKRLNKAQELGKVASWEVNLPTMQGVWSDQFYRLLGYETGEVEPDYPLVLHHVHPEDRESVTTAYSAFLETHTQTDIEFRYLDSRGRPGFAHMQVTMELDSEGTPERVFGTFQDITARKRAEEDLARYRDHLKALVQEKTSSLTFALERQAKEIKTRKRAEKALRESEKKLQAIVDTAQDAIIVAQDNKLVFINPATETLLGYSFEELRGRSFTDFIYPEDADFVQERCVKRLEGADVPPEYDFRILTKDKSIKWVQIHAIVFEWEERSAILSVLTDITERKRDEKVLIQAKEAAEVANRAKSEFLANMSHELRTPLNGIMGLLQLLNIEPLTEGQLEDVRLALTASENLLELINSILDLSKIEAEKMPIREDQFDLAALVSNVYWLMHTQVQKKNLLLEYAIESDVPKYLYGDSLRFKQVLFNLVGNAIKFTKKGEVHVRIGMEPVQDSDDSIILHCTVSDTGIGIPPEKFEYAFEPFTQVDGGHSRKYSGTGLGLSIVKRLVTLMGGEVHVESELGAGSTFHFTTPVKTVPRASTDKSSLGAFSLEVTAPRLRILFAEDEPVNQRVIKRMLEIQGHAVSCVENGREVLAAIERESFDLILMDVQMPEMDGAEATRIIRKDERFNELPIVALTAHAMPEDQERCLEAGMDDYIAKPVKLEELKKVLARVMGK